MKFDTLDYLQDGNTKQKEAYYTLKKNFIFEKLQAFSPLLTGTIPINIDTEESDLDIVCYWRDRGEFIRTLTKEFHRHDEFILQEQKLHDRQTVVVNFLLGNCKIEIFGQNRPTKEQESFRHMVIEYEILSTYGESFRQEIIKLKKEGLKTEPAFAKLLGLVGDPYEELLNYKVNG